MPRASAKSLAGQAASAVTKVVTRRTSSEPAPADEPVDESAAPAKEAAVRKPAARKAAAKTTAAKKPNAHQAAAKKAAAKRTPVKKSSAPDVPPTPTRAAPAATAERESPVTNVADAGHPKSDVAAEDAPAGDLVVKSDEDAWTEAELAEVLDELNDQRAHGLALLAAQEQELSGLMRDSGDGAGQDQADVGATSFERDYELTVLNIERDKLAQIERAQARISDGTYGVCESCEEPIGKMRLMAFPRATLCVTCKQREERR